MRKILTLLLFSILFMTGCINNDLPYPLVVPNITSMTVQNAVSVDIDYNKREMTVCVSETTDLKNVVVQSVDIDVDFTTSSIPLLGVHDLTSPLKFTLTTYQDYEWTLKAIRPIERYFTVSGQIGTAIIDEYNCRIIAMVAEGTDISDLNVTSLKLGPDGITTYSISRDQMKDFTNGVEVDVTAFGDTKKWTIYIEFTDIRVQISNVNPWTKSAYITAMAVADSHTQFKYRQKGATQWEEVASEDITADGGTFVAYIKNLSPQTDYEVIAISDDSETPAEEFTTAPATKIPNGSFEYVSLVNGSNYYKFYDPTCGVEEGETMFWGSGNGEGSEGVNGSAAMGIIITTVDKNTKVDGNNSVCAATSQLAGILAAGNIFTGQFAGLVGTEGGMVNFGRPWTTRPVALKLHCKYTTSNIDIIGKKMPPGVTLTKQDYDRAQIKVAIGTWDYRTYGGTRVSPVHVNTTDPGTFVDFSKDPSTIANGEVIIHKDGYYLNGKDKVDATTSEWAEYTIPLTYHDMETLPTHIIVSVASSQFGDYFTGCSSSKLWVDKVELVY